MESLQHCALFSLNLLLATNFNRKVRITPLKTDID